MRNFKTDAPGYDNMAFPCLVVAVQLVMASKNAPKMLSSSKLIRLPDPVGKFIDALNECPSLDCEPYPDCPDPDCNDMELWEMAVESLRNRILADEDWAMCDLVLDLPPEESNKIKRSMGTNGKYFTDVASLASDDDAHESWKNIIQRITGKRPTIPLRYDDSEPF